MSGYPTSDERYADAAMDAPRPARCEAVFVTDYGRRRCDLEPMHGGPHIRNDGTGRPEYVWERDGQILR